MQMRTSINISNGGFNYLPRGWDAFLKLKPLLRSNGYQYHSTAL
jgi:hypothetical protein